MKCSIDLVLKGYYKVVLIFFFICGSSFAQNESSIDAYEDLVGTWKSKLDKKYKDHPMIKKFNPELKPQLIKFYWGDKKRVIHMSIYNLDRPKVKDTTLLVTGLIVPSASNTVKMVDYNIESKTLYEGIFKLDSNNNIIRVFESHTSDGTARKFKEEWKWSDESKRKFEWHTYHYTKSEYKKGDVVIDYSKID